jgi:hypothetical protein
MADTKPSGREPVREFMVRGTKFEVAEKYGLIKVRARAQCLCSCVRPLNPG